MANTALMTALGALGAGFSEYGNQRRINEQLAREQADRDFQRQQLLNAQARADDATRRQNERDVLDAILGGLRPAGGTGPVSLAGRQFNIPNVLTPEEKIAERVSRFMAAYPTLNRYQAELLARGEMKPGDMLVDPGTTYRGPARGTGTRTGGRTTTPPAGGAKPTAWSLNFGTDSLGVGP
jgi:hypothetical protein